MSIVKENLMTRIGYTPYCGKEGKCFYQWPRMEFDGKQFFCRCGYRTQFPEEFIQKYKEKWGFK